MPTVTTNYDFAGGTAPISGFGDRWQIQFGGTWDTLEKWGLTFVSTESDFDVGSINFYAASVTPTVAFVFKNRAYLGSSTQFNYSDNGTPLGWEQQSPGAGFQKYLSYFGGQDTVNAMSQLQGRFIVVARRSVQIWNTDADPSLFALVQEMDNIGTQAPLSVQNIGDFDVIILDDTGFRSLRTREVTLNAYVDDVGVAIDSLVQADLLSVAASTCCGIVEPTTKNYWGYLNGKIYVLSRYPSSKVQAWTTFLPQYEAYTTLNPGANYVASQLTQAVTIGNVYKWTPGAHEVSLVNGTQTLTAAGYFQAQGTTVTINGTGATVTYTGTLQLVTLTTFTPTKFIVYNGLVYLRGSDNHLYVYGGTNNNTYDTSVATVQLPWLDDKQPNLEKEVQAIGAALNGYWHITGSTNPIENQFIPVWDGPPSGAQGSELTDSTYDYLRIGWRQIGTHMCLILATDVAWGQFAAISEIQLHYNKGQQP